MSAMPQSSWFRLKSIKVMVKREADGVRVGQVPRTPGVLLHKIKCAEGRWAKKKKNKTICLT